MKYALIGCGRIARNHIAAAIENRLEIAALCDVVPEHAQRYIQENGLDSRVYINYREMLAETKPDFVAIATESGKHAAIALDCIQAGVNVLIEKPIALSVKDGDAILTAARARGVTVGVCHQNRFNKAVQRLRKAIDEERFGKIYHIAAAVHWNRDEGYYRQAPWRGTWAQDGGCLMNQCIHNIDLLQWAGGEIDSIVGCTGNFQHPYIEGEDFGTAIVKFKSGALGSIDGTVNVFPCNLEETLTVLGERGTVRLGGKSVNTIEVWDFADGKDSMEDIRREASEQPPNIYGFGHMSLYADFIQALTQGRAPYITGEDGKRAMETVLAIYRSSSEGRFVSLPLTSGSTLDFMEK